MSFYNIHVTYTDMYEWSGDDKVIQTEQQGVSGVTLISIFNSLIHINKFASTYSILSAV